jgi:hypothetical protein
MVKNYFCGCYHLAISAITWVLRVGTSRAHRARGPPDSLTVRPRVLLGSLSLQIPHPDIVDRFRSQLPHSQARYSGRCSFLASTGSSRSSFVALHVLLRFIFCLACWDFPLLIIHVCSVNRMGIQILACYNVTNELKLVLGVA